MTRKEEQVRFGRLLTALRKEHRDEHGYRWTQQRLASEAALTATMVGKIERGERSVQPDELLELADALQLTSSERKEFFLAAVGVENTAMAASQNDPQAVLDDLINRMSQMHLPAYIIDAYCDVVAANAATMRLFGLNQDQIRSMTVGPPINANMLRFVFSPEFDFRPVMGERWHNYAFQNMMNFRTCTLRYRATDYFAYLFTELRRWPLFRKYWEYGITTEARDHCTDNEYIQLNLPPEQGGKLTFISTAFSATTREGDLLFNIYIPLGSATVAHFDAMVAEVGTTVHLTHAWPHKRPHYAAARFPIKL